MNWMKSDSIVDLANALSLAQGEFKAALKDASNPFFKTKYADLNSVLEVAKPVLAKRGLSLIQIPTTEGPKVTLTTIILHSSGEYVAGDLAMLAKDSTPQSIGSAITYARRYGASSMLGISTEDDDGQAAQPSKHDRPMYDNRDVAMVKTLKQLLNKRGVPEEHHEKIGSLLHGKSSTELDKILKELE